MDRDLLFGGQRVFVSNVAIKPRRDIEDETGRDRGFGTGGDGKFGG